MYTVESAFLIPVILCIICVFLLGTVSMFETACDTLQSSYIENANSVRQPAEVIRNTDLFFSYIEKFSKEWVSES